MTCQTIPLFFKVPSEIIQNEAFEKDLNEIGRLCLDDVETRHDISVGNGDRIITMISKNTSHATMRIYSSIGLVTVDISYVCVGATCPEDNYEALEKVKEQYSLSGKGDSWQEFIINRLEDRIRNYLGDKCLKMEAMPCPIRRGDALWTYTTTSTEQIREAEYDKLVFKMVSEWQKIEIFHSPLHGNVLCLDGVMMLSEGDVEYHDLCLGIGSHKRNDFKGKSVLFLGGGGGAGLNFILKEDPNMVVMCEIDGEVVNACRKYMRKICGTSLDSMEGPHHKIIIGDGFQVLKGAIKDGMKYDYVADDMSMFVVDPDTQERNIDITSRNESALSLSKQVLKPGGIYFQALDPKPAKVHTNFQKAVKSAGGVFTVRESECIPSFLENYIFYEVTFPEPTN